MQNMANKMKTKSIFKLLGFIQIFIGIGAIPSGLSMIINPSGAGMQMPIEMLENSPFSNFLIPGLFLFAVNGLANLIAGIISLKQHKLTWLIALGLGTFLMVWLLVQLYWIGFHWLQVFYFFLGFIEVYLGLRIKKEIFGKCN